MEKLSNENPTTVTDSILIEEQTSFWQRHPWIKRGLIIGASLYVLNLASVALENWYYKNFKHY